jgi:hypothetical protein
MISKKKDYENPPESLKRENENWKRSVIKCIEAAKGNEKQVFSEYLYGQAREKLIDMYDGKCAYCESNPLATSHLSVEHFRPKSQYYWLAYEWSNLTLSCIKCNESGAKGVKFPVDGIQLKNPILTLENLPDIDSLDIKGIHLINEKAVFLNPEIDKVEGHITFNDKGEPIGLTERGKVTIRELGLDRPNLNYDRLKKLKKFRDTFENLILGYVDNIAPNYQLYQRQFNKNFDDMNKPLPKKQFIHFRNTIFENFDELFINYFQKEINDEAALILREFYENYKASL